jgi:ABC-type branched-subunit amino acid transport system substrate-binding protein
MGRLLKYVMYAIFLALVPAIYLYLYGLPSLVDSVSVPEKPKEAVALAAPVAIASTGEELDHRVAQWLGLLASYAQSATAKVERLLPADKASALAAPVAIASTGEELDHRVAQWLGLLASYAQSATAKVERLLPADKASAPAVAEVSNGGSAGAKAVAEATRPAPPSPAMKVAALTADEVCKRDGERLARLRSSPSSDEAGRFANELGCEKLRPQLRGLMESLGHAVPAPAVAEVSNGGTADAKAVAEATRPAPPSPAMKVANASSVVAANNAAPPLEKTNAKDNAVRGVSDKEILFGMAAPFTGASRELGRQMKIGVETAFSQTNYAGGVNGRLLRLIAADDGYEPTRTADVMQVLYDKDQVFGFIGNVGTPTAAVALPFALDHRALFFGAFTGAGLLRSDPPDRYVFNYRASYAEETDAVVRYLVKVKRIQPKEIVVFAQQDSYGDSGYAGVQKAVRSLPGENPDIVRLNYKRNTVDVQDAVNWLRSFKGQIKAVVMVASYRAAAKFIEKTRDFYSSMIYTNVSFVGSTALTDELMLLGPRYATGVVVTQVVPAINSYASIVLKYKEALAKYFPGEPPDYVSFEGYIDANILAEAVKRVGRDINTEKLVDELERMHDFDLGLGTPVTFSSNEHQGSHKVWGTQLDETGHYQPIDLR